MLSTRARQTALLGATLDSVLLCAAFALAFVVRRFLPLSAFETKTPDVVEHFSLLLFGLPLFWVLASAMGVYDPARMRTARLNLLPLVEAFAGTAIGLTAVIFLAQAKGFSRVVFLLFLAIGLCLTATGKAIHQLWLRRTAGTGPAIHVLVVGGDEDVRDIRERIAAHPEFGMRIVAVLPDAGDALKRTLEETPVDEVVFAVPPEALPQLGTQIGWCEEVGVTVHVKADFVRTLVARTYATELDGIPMLTFAPTSRDAASLLVKRAMDVAISGIGLAVLSPVLALIAAAIKLTSPGPVLFTQKRVGLNGRIFPVYKFRSMFQDAEQRKQELMARNEMAGPVFKLRRDPRVTPVGRLLRTFSLDELPQLWNVLVGHMSLVGPRPPIPDEVRLYKRWQRRRLSMKPGMTCLWQVNGRNRITSFEEWMKLDLEYIDHWSLGLDVKILLRTLPAVVLARGAE